MTLHYIYLAAIGLSYILTESYLFESVRLRISTISDENLDSSFWDLFDYFWNCIICMSMWTFLPFYTLFFYNQTNSWQHFIIYWFSTPVFVIIFNKIVEYLSKD